MGRGGWDQFGICASRNGGEPSCSPEASHLFILLKGKLGPETSSDFRSSQSLLVAKPRVGLQFLLLWYVFLFFSSSPPSSPPLAPPPSSLSSSLSKGKGRGHKQADLFVLAAQCLRNNSCFLLFRWSLPLPSPSLRWQICLSCVAWKGIWARATVLGEQRGFKAQAQDRLPAQLC